MFSGAAGAGRALPSVSHQPEPVIGNIVADIAGMSTVQHAIHQNLNQSKIAHSIRIGDGNINHRRAPLPWHQFDFRRGRRHGFSF